MTSQKDAVFAAITKVAEADKSFSRETAVEELAQMFSSGEVACGDTTISGDEARRYSSSLISNWLRKDTRLAGYAAKGTVSRSSPSTPRTPRPKREPVKADEQMKKLVAAKALLVKEKLPTDDIDAMINLRQKELNTVRNAQREQIMKKLAEDLKSVGVELPVEASNDAG